MYVAQACSTAQIVRPFLLPPDDDDTDTEHHFYVEVPHVTTRREKGPFGRERIFFPRGMPTANVHFKCWRAVMDPTVVSERSREMLR